MKRANLINVFSWALTHISWITMVFSPVAYGEQAQKMTAEKWNEEAITNAFADIGANFGV